MRRSAFLAITTVVVFLCAFGESGSMADARAAPPSESVVFFYQSIGSSDQSKFSGARAVVAGEQADDTAAITTIHNAGALALKYTNIYWYPSGTSYEGIDIAAHKDWAFCKKGQTPYVGRTQNHIQWFYIDANEQAARTAIDAYLDHLKSVGYDGVFFDRGAAAFRGNKGAITWKASTCTADPVHSRRRRFSDIYAGVIHDAYQRGLTVYLNYGRPYSGARLRPDPNDKQCRLHLWAECRPRRGVRAWVSEIIDETRGGVGAAKQFSYEFRSGAQSEAHLPASGVPIVIREIKVESANRRAVYYRWARARLHRVMTFVDTGDDGCFGDIVCYRFGTYPELTAITLGRPVEKQPRAFRCTGTSMTSCLWVRRYRDGMTVVNPTKRIKIISRLDLKLSSCRYVKDVYRSAKTTVALGEDACLNRVTYRVPPHSGRVFIYSASPW